MTEKEIVQALRMKPDRLRELAEADKDGRVVVLPCKVGEQCVDEDGRAVRITAVIVSMETLGDNIKIYFDYEDATPDDAGSDCVTNWDHFSHQFTCAEPYWITERIQTMPDEYISRAELLEHLDRCKQSEDATTLTAAVITALQCIVQSQPAADVAPVVRCKDCIYNIDGMCFSRTSFKNAVAVEPDNFCSWGTTE